MSVLKHLKETTTTLFNSSVTLAPYTLPPNVMFYVPQDGVFLLVLLRERSICTGDSDPANRTSQKRRFFTISLQPIIRISGGVCVTPVIVSSNWEFVNKTLQVPMKPSQNISQQGAFSYYNGY